MWKRYDLTGAEEGIIQLDAGDYLKTENHVYAAITGASDVLSNHDYLAEIKELLLTLYRERYHVGVLGKTKEAATLSFLSIIGTSANYYGRMIRNRTDQILTQLMAEGSKTITKVNIDTMSEVIDDPYTDDVLTKESDSGKTAFNADLTDDNYLSRAVRQSLSNDERKRQLMSVGYADDNYTEVIRELDIDDLSKIDAHLKNVIKLWIEYIEEQILVH